MNPSPPETLLRTEPTLTPGHEETTRGTKRQRSTGACKRCKGRKQKCSNTQPCTNCSGAGVECIYPEQPYPTSYVRSLEERVAYLETQLQNGLSVSQEASDHHPTLNNLKSPRPQTSSSAVTQPCPSNDMQGDFPLVSLYSSTEHSFLGSTSGYPLSRMLQSVVNKQLIVGDGTQSRSYTMGEIKSAKPARMPSDEESDMLLQVYWSKFHAKHPFLSRNEILNLNKQRHELSAQRNDINPQKLHSSPRPVRATSRKLHLSLFKLNMIYAISARYIQLRQAKETENTPEEYYNAASREIDAVLSVKDLDTIDSLLLLVLYQLRSPSYPGMWHLVRHAMTSSVETGLHRKARIPSLVENERRKRLFWCVYSLDRAVAMALGRPHSISERDIDTELPSNVDDSIDDEETLAQAINDSISFPKRSTSISAAIHQIRLRIIESRIHETLYSARRPDTIPAEEIVLLQQQLTDWKANIPDSPQMDSEEQTHRSRQMHLLHYYKSIRLLYLPRVISFESSPQEFQRCIEAAGQICQLQKQIHHTQAIAWSLLGLHATYLAGLTLIYGFYLSRTIFDFKFSSDIRACSTVLYVIAERWPAAAKYRDAFEELVANLIESDQQQTESNNSSKGIAINTGNENSSGNRWSQNNDQVSTPAVPDFSSAFNPTEQTGWQMQDPYFHPVAASHAFGGVAGEQAWEMFEDLIDKNFRHQVRGIHLGIPTYFAPHNQ